MKIKEKFIYRMLLVLIGEALIMAAIGHAVDNNLIKSICGILNIVSFVGIFGIGLSSYRRSLKYKKLSKNTAFFYFYEKFYYLY